MIDPRDLEGVRRGPSDAFEEIPKIPVACQPHERKAAIRRGREDDVGVLLESGERGLEVFLAPA